MVSLTTKSARAYSIIFAWALLGRHISAAYAGHGIIQGQATAQAIDKTSESAATTVGSPAQGTPNGWAASYIPPHRDEPSSSLNRRSNSPARRRQEETMNLNKPCDYNDVVWGPGPYPGCIFHDPNNTTVVKRWVDTGENDICFCGGRIGNGGVPYCYSKREDCSLGQKPVCIRNVDPTTGVVLDTSQKCDWIETAPIITWSSCGRGRWRVGNQCVARYWGYG